MKWIAILLLLCILPGQCAWYNTGWGYRAKITTQNGKVNADLTDYPIYVKLDDFGSGHGIWGHAMTTGADLRVTTSDGTTEVPIEVVKINTTTKVGEIHFKATGTLSNTTNADFYLYYGNGDASAYAASATYGKNNVWEANYKIVSHMQSSSVDSTVNGNTGSDTSVSYATAGQIGNGATSDAVSDKVVYADNNSLDISPDQTVSFWVKSASSNQKYVASKYNTTGSSSWALNTDVNVTNPGGWDNKISSDGTFDNVLDKLYRGGPSTFDNTWHLVHQTFASNSLVIYEDGVDVTGSFSILWAGVTAVIAATTASVNLFESAGALNGIIGTIDEFRIAKTTRGSTWCSTEYNNQSSPSTFYTIAAEEAQPAGGATANAINFGILF